MIALSTIYNLLNCAPSDVLNIYIYGSRLTGTATETSGISNTQPNLTDFDIIVIIKDNVGVLEYKKIQHEVHYTPYRGPCEDTILSDVVDINVFTLPYFKKLLRVGL